MWWDGEKKRHHPNPASFLFKKSFIPGMESRNYDSSTHLQTQCYWRLLECWQTLNNVHKGHLFTVSLMCMGCMVFSIPPRHVKYQAMRYQSKYCTYRRVNICTKSDFYYNMTDHGMCISVQKSKFGGSQIWLKIWGKAVGATVSRAALVEGPIRTP